MRHLLFALLLAALHSAPARADGFFDPPEPTPERRAELDAIRAEAESMGLPVLPPEAEYVHVAAFESETIRYSGRHGQPAGNGWRIPPAACGDAEVFVSVAGHRLGVPPARPPAWVHARLELARVVLAHSINKDLPATFFGHAGTTGVLLFAVQLAQTGHSDAGAEILALLDDRGLLESARSGLRAALANAAMREAYDTMFATGDFAAVADILARSLAANPPASDDTDARADALQAASRRLNCPGIANVLAQSLAEGSPIVQEDALRAAIKRLAVPTPDVPGLNAEEQELVRALDDWVWDGRSPHAFSARSVIWLVPSAWTNVVVLPDDALRRILIRGPSAFRILNALRDDDRPVRAVGLLPIADGHVPQPFLRRKDLAWEIAGLMLSGVRSYSERDLPVGPRGASEEDALLYYVHYYCDFGPRLDMLNAHLARLAGDGPLPWLEDAVLGSLRTNFWGTASDNGGWIKPLSGKSSPPFAERYLAVRGQASAAFRDRLCETLRDAWTKNLGPDSHYRYNPGIVGSPDYSKTFSDMERRFAVFPLGAGTPESIRARADALADWLLAKARYENRGLFTDSQPPPTSPPIPLPLFEANSLCD